ncbi:uncharacterized protein LOC119674396 [Teleopsis dalmanni]|uniref:uncharacterized protein LOC119674396 n=1 Tax=Teleopsis dalmanni TaxID=139649 RepID=UPI0018CE7462|nr:uncharacterized protein LOC119674396 [Teleopsis dalmanni]
MEYEYNEQLTAFESFLTELHKNRCQVSVQEIVTNVLVNENGVETFETTATMGCYVFNINPALAIVFNHMNFSNLDMREASINDINRLKNSFIRKKIPLLIIKDGSAEEVKRVMNFGKLKKKNYKK